MRICTHSELDVTIDGVRATLGNIGLVAYDGKETEAPNVLKEEAQKRGW